MDMTIKTTVNLGGQIVEGTVTASGDGQNNADVALAADATNIQVLEAFKITDLTLGALVFISTGQAITVKTNSSSVPDDTFSIPAGGAIRVSALEADIASLYVTNESGTVATGLQIRGVKDVTP